MKQIVHIPYFLLLLPLYFFLHAITHLGLHPSFAHLGLWYILLQAIAFGLWWMLRRKKQFKPVSVLIFTWSFAYLFFGHIKDTMPVDSIFFSYYFLVPAILIIPFIIYQYLKKRAIMAGQVFQYLNVLIVLLCSIQLVMAYKPLRHACGTYRKSMKFSEPTQGSKPSIYLILFDEYPGRPSLQHYYGFSNEALFAQLRNLDFYVFDTMRSNYDKTVYSVNSMLNMQYIDQTVYQPVSEYTTYLKNYLAIRHNNVAACLRSQGYRIENHSLFSMHGQETTYSFPLLYTSNVHLYKEVFHERLKRDLLWKLYCGPYRMAYFYDKYLLHTYHQNNRVIAETIQQAKSKHRQPVFHMAHLLMPHEPIFTDSLGNVYDMEHQRHTSDTTQQSLQYLVYTNKRMVSLADSLVKYDPQAVIILFSDHGIRDTPPENRNYYCDNFMAIRLPEKQYQVLQPIRSNVNVFRVLLNHYAGQHLSVLPDSSYSIDEEKNSFQVLQPIR